MGRFKLGCSWVVGFALAGCSDAPQTEFPDGSATGETETENSESTGSSTNQAEITYESDVRAIIESRCRACHDNGGIAPFALTTYDEVYSLRAAVAASVDGGSMPPWQPADDCNSYVGDFSLEESERDLILDWVEQGAAQGDPDDYVAPPTEALEPFIPDFELVMPEPYSPQGAPDDYRCFVIDWPDTDRRFVTGFRAQPDRTDLVHHVLAYVAGPDDVERYHALDESDPGPGYTCYGGPNAADQSTTVDGRRPDQIGSWVPGVRVAQFPAGTGIEVEPGSVMIVQMHYNTLTAEPGPDQSRIQVKVAQTVERPAVTFLALDPRWLTDDGMSIAAGEPSVTHESDLNLSAFFPFLGADRIGLGPGDAYLIHSVGFHMHELGEKGRTSIIRANGDEQCLLDLPSWDFAWQASYPLEQAALVQPGDRIRIRCQWDNSAQNQPIVDGVQQPPRDVSWGEGTSDEMCLSGLFLTAP